MKSTTYAPEFPGRGGTDSGAGIDAGGNGSTDCNALEELSTSPSAVV